MPTTRLEAFSDGVFAIAMTLLVLEVRVHPTEGQSLLAALLHAWPSYVAYAVSFTVIGIMWVNHHATFDRVERADRRLLFLNLVLLGVVAFLPFPTALLAEYLRESPDDARTAAVLYSCVMLMASLSFALVWGYLDRHGELLVQGIEEHVAGTALRRSYVGVAVYATTILVALWSPMAALVCYAAVALFYVFAERPVSRGGGRG